MFVTISFTKLSEKILLDFSEVDVTSKKFRTYIRQQHERHEIYRRTQAFQASIISSIVVREKFFYIKIMRDKSNLFSKNSYAEWIQYVWEMKNQFDMNQMNDIFQEHFVKTNKIKFFFVVIFLKKDFNAQLLWSVKARNNSNKAYIWTKYVNFLKDNIKRIFIKKENNFEKYRNYKQRFNQSIRDYDAHRIVLISKLHSIMKFSTAIEFQNFVLNLIQNNQIFFVEQEIEDDRDLILKRFKQRENNERKKQRNINNNKSNDDFNKRKKNDENFDVEENNKNQFNKSQKEKNKNDKKFKIDNFNQESIKSKRLYRWIKKNVEIIRKKDRCLECDKSNCNIKKCENKKFEVHSKKITFDLKSKK